MKQKSIYILLALAFAVCSCTKLNYNNPNGPTDTEVLTTREGLISLCIGMKQYYATTGLQALIITPGTSSRETKGITTFTNVLEIEAGGTALPTFNGNVLGLWSAMLRTMGMGESLISNAPSVLATDNATQTGVIAFGKLFKAMSIGGLATAFEQFPIQTDKNGKSVFVTRASALQTAVQLLNEAAASLGTTPPSAEFNTRVLGTDIILLDCINTYLARYNMMLGKYTEALAAANAVNLATKSQFVYSSQSPNPVYQQIAVAANYRPRDNFGLPAGFVESGDQRVAFYLSTPDAVVNGETLKTLKGFFNAINSPIPFYIPDELHLLKAEAIIRSGGSLTTAKSEIDAVRTQTSGDPFGVNAGLPAYSGPVTSTDMLLEIYKQRSIELFMEGLRLEDSRRFGRAAPPTNVNPVPVSFERNRNFYPYPDQERLTNPGTPTDPVI